MGTFDDPVSAGDPYLSDIQNRLHTERSFQRRRGIFEKRRFRKGGSFDLRIADDGSVFEVTVEPLDGETPDELEFHIIVKCLTDPQYDFTTWGSDVPREFEDIFHEVKD